MSVTRVVDSGLLVIYLLSDSLDSLLLSQSNLVCEVENIRKPVAHTEPTLASSVHTPTLLASPRLAAAAKGVADKAGT